MQSGNVAAYVAGSGLHEGGWRDLQSSDLRNFYGDIGWRGERGEVHVNVTVGADPAQRAGHLAGRAAGRRSRRAVHRPQPDHQPLHARQSDRQLTIFRTTRRCKGTLYYDYFLQKVVNGNVTDVTPCDDGSGLSVRGARRIRNRPRRRADPGFPERRPLFASWTSRSTNTNGYGAALQVTNRTRAVRSAQPARRRRQLRRRADLVRRQHRRSAACRWPIAMFVGPGIVVDQADGSIAPVRVGHLQRLLRRLFHRHV